MRGYEEPLIEAILGRSLHPGGAALTSELARLARIAPGCRVLDVACGPGSTLETLSRGHGATSVGLDPSRPLLRRARSAGADALVMGTGGDLPFMSESFDAAFVECSLCLTGEPAVVLAEMRRVLVPGGRLVMSDVTLEGPQEALRDPVFSLACLREALPRKSLERLLNASGLRIDLYADRSDALVEFRSRVLERMDVYGLLETAASAGSETAARGLAFATALGGALRAGDIGYAVAVARK